VHVQFEPEMAVGSRPPGGTAVTATAVPSVGPLPVLETVRLYAAPVCACVKEPVWEEVMIRVGGGGGAVVKNHVLDGGALPAVLLAMTYQA